MHEWAKLMSWEFILGPLFCAQQVVLLDFDLHNISALLEHFNLRRQLVHLILIFEYQIFIAVSDLAFEVL